MKAVILVLMGLMIQSAHASGGFVCETSDKTVVVEGGLSSAGIWVREVSINGKSLRKDVEFTAQQIYIGASVFNFLVMDGNYNEHLLRVETKKAGESLFKGVAVIGEYGPNERKQRVSCELLY